MKDTRDSGSGRDSETVIERPVGFEGNGQAVTAAEQHRRVARERAAVFERAVSSLSHALGTPLQVISGRAAMIRMDSADDEVREHAKIIERKVQDVTQLMQRLLDFARGHDFDVTTADLAGALRAGVDAVEPLAHERGVRLEVDARAPAPCAASMETLFLLAINLLLDAVDSSRRGSTVKISISPRESIPSQFAGGAQHAALLRLHFAEGTSMDPKAFDRGHEPWMKTDPGDRNVALRRSVVFGALRRVGGFLQLTYDDGIPAIAVWIPVH